MRTGRSGGVIVRGWGVGWRGGVGRSTYCVCSVRVRGRIRVFDVEMSGFESIDRDGIVAIVDSNGEMFISS